MSKRKLKRYDFDTPEIRLAEEVNRAWSMNEWDRANDLLSAPYYLVDHGCEHDEETSFVTLIGLIEKASLDCCLATGEKPEVVTPLVIQAIVSYSIMMEVAENLVRPAIA